jgi:hypothetical protein
MGSFKLGVPAKKNPNHRGSGFLNQDLLAKF